jgi:hypothetical protein
MTLEKYPRITDVVPLEDKCLLVAFENGARKLYDCGPLLELNVFAPLHNDWLFRTVRVDIGGYGISWADEIDLSESELWENGYLLTDAESVVGALPDIQGHTAEAE